MPTPLDRARSHPSVFIFFAVALCAAMAVLPTSISAQTAKPPSGELRWALHVTLAARWLDPAETEAFSTPFMVICRARRHGETDAGRAHHPQPARIVGGS